jgi:hypothetical protein
MCRRVSAKRKRSGPLAVGSPVLLELPKAGKPLLGPEQGSRGDVSTFQLAGEQFAGKLRALIACCDGFLPVGHVAGSRRLRDHVNVF